MAWCDLVSGRIGGAVWTGGEENRKRQGAWKWLLRDTLPVSGENWEKAAGVPQRGRVRKEQVVLLDTIPARPCAGRLTLLPLTPRKACSRPCLKTRSKGRSGHRACGRAYFGILNPHLFSWEMFGLYTASPLAGGSVESGGRGEGRDEEDVAEDRSRAEGNRTWLGLIKAGFRVAQRLAGSQTVVCNWATNTFTFKGSRGDLWGTLWLWKGITSGWSFTERGKICFPKV